MGRDLPLPAPTLKRALAGPAQICRLYLLHAQGLSDQNVGLLANVAAALELWAGPCILGLVPTWNLRRCWIPSLPGRVGAMS
eukprot:794305-Pyramimonas_sp.AAC.1